MVRRLICLFTAALIFQSTIFAADISIKASAQKSEYTVGDVAQFVFNVSGWETLTIKLPEPKILYSEKNVKNDDQTSKIPLCEIIDFKELDSLNSEEKLYEMKAVFYRTGVQSMPKIAFVDKDGIEVGYNIPQINIKTVNEQNQFADIEPPVSLKGNYYRLIWLIIGVILLAAAITSAVIYYNKRRKKIVPTAVEIPAYEIFKNEINKLKDSNQIETDGEQYVVTLSLIFRRYISKLFNFNASDMTDDEIIRATLESTMRRERYEIAQQIRDVMSPWNLAKFAELIPPQNILEDNLAMVEKLGREFYSRFGR